MKHGGRQSEASMPHALREFGNNCTTVIRVFISPILPNQTPYGKTI